MYYVEIKNPCSCTIKRALPERQEFETQDEAERQAKQLLEQMDFEFCKKHCFELKKEFGNFVIYIKTRF